MPTLTLYSMSMSDFGRQMKKVSKLIVISQFLSLSLINIPFLSVRLYLWATYNYELSLFVVKNLCYMFLLVHSLYPGMVRLFARWKLGREKVSSISDASRQPFRQESAVSVVDGGVHGDRGTSQASPPRVRSSMRSAESFSTTRPTDAASRYHVDFEAAGPSTFRSDDIAMKPLNGGTRPSSS